MLNCVMIVQNRPRLTSQALHTFVENTDVPWTLTIVDDASQPETRDLLRAFARTTPNVALLRNENSKGIVGQVRNLGVYWTERYFGRGEWLYHSDNDVAFLPGWASAMIEAMVRWQETGKPLVLGGQRHPFHGLNPGGIGFDGTHIMLTDAVAGYSQLMRWPAWDTAGPFDAHAKGVCQSEDFAFCQTLIKDGGRVGYIHPPVIAHCGITNSEGKPAIGSEHFERLPELIYE